MIVVVTGATGFLGGHVVPLLLDRGHIVKALVRSSSAQQVAVRLGADPLDGNLDDPQSVDHAFGTAGGEALVNLASLGFGHAPTIVAAAEEAGLNRALFVSTTGIFTRLPAPSKVVRVAAEELIKSSGLDWTIVRPTMIYGTPGDRNMSRLLRFLSRSPVVPLPGGGQGLQQPVHVADLAQAVVYGVERAVAIHKCYDVCGPEQLSMAQIVEQAGAALGRRPLVVPIPLGPPIFAARVYEHLSARPRLKAEQLQRLAEDKVFAIDAARDDLGFRPRSFAVGIEQEAALLR
jgi:uncharacterized protein YbjT (DUF2867 family)